MDIIQFLTASAGAAIALGYLSLMFWRENPWSRWAEYTIVGIGTAYAVVVTTWTLVNMAIRPLIAGDLSKLVPIIIGLLVYSQFSRKYRWILKWPMAFITAIGITITLTGVITSNLLLQLKDLATPLTTVGTTYDVINAIIVIIGAICTLSYFTFTREHRGALSVTAKIGRYFMMAAFGAGFGMAFISQGTFLITIIIFLLRDWLGIPI